MHELSIVKSIIGIADSAVSNRSEVVINRIDLEIGELSGVEYSALDFAWDIATKDTVLEDAERCIDKVKGMARCSECDHEFEIKQLYDPCPNCASYFNEVLKGKELRVKSITIN